MTPAERTKKWKLENRERHLAQKKRWRERHPDKMRETNARKVFVGGTYICMAPSLAAATLVNQKVREESKRLRKEYLDGRNEQSAEKG